MLTKVLALVLVVLIGLALGIETARYVHGAGDASTGMVNIHLVVFTGVLLTVLWVSRAWLARQWTRFTVWFELTLDGLFDFNSLDVGDGLGRISGSTSSALGTPERSAVRLASDCGVAVKPPDPAKIPTAHPVAVGASSYLIDPAEVPPSMVVLFDETECVGAGPNGTSVKKPRVSVRVVKLVKEDTPERAPTATAPQKERYKIEREIMPSEWGTLPDLSNVKRNRA